MENQNNQTPPTPSTGSGPSPAATATAPVTTPTTPAVSTTAQPPVSNNINNLKDKFNNMSPQQKRLVLIVGGALMVAIVSLVLAGILKSSRPTAPTYVPTPTPASSTPFPETKIDRPSVYATDSAVLKLEESINEKSKIIDGMDVEESQLRPQDINFKVDFDN